MAETTIENHASDTAATFDHILAALSRGEGGSIERVVDASREVRAAEVRLREALAGIGEEDGAGWARYARSADASMVHMEIELTVAAAALKAERAVTHDEVRRSVLGAADAVRARLDELRVRAHLGELDLQDATGHRAEALERATRQVATVLASAEQDAGASIGQLRTAAVDAIGELRHSLADLAAAVRPGGPTR